VLKPSRGDGFQKSCCIQRASLSARTHWLLSSWWVCLTTKAKLVVYPPYRVNTYSQFYQSRKSMTPIHLKYAGRLLIITGLFFAIFGVSIFSMCTTVGCSEDTGITVRSIDLSSLTVTYDDSCNWCRGSLVPSLGGMVCVGCGLVVPRLATHD
jgi:hypothetical protein